MVLFYKMHEIIIINIIILCDHYSRIISFVSGKYASSFVRGMQSPDSKGRPMMLAYLKHFAAYSRETNRGHDSYLISKHDLFESYLPQFEIAFNGSFILLFSSVHSIILKVIILHNSLCSFYVLYHFAHILSNERGIRKRRYVLLQRNKWTSVVCKHFFAEWYYAHSV